MSKRFLTFAVPCLMLTVALVQLVLSTFSTLSAWKGGGFGMFSRIVERGLSCQVKSVDGTLAPCLIPFKGQGEYGPFTNTRRSSLRTFPTQKKLESILADYAKSNPSMLIYEDVPDQDGKLSRKIVGEKSILGMRLSMWELHFDQPTLGLEMRPMNIQAQALGWEGP